MEGNREEMKQALEALEYIYEGANNQGPHTGISWRDVSNKSEAAITALRQALANEALDKMAENARELGLDYEPAAQRWAVFCGECKKTWSVSYPHPGNSICSDCEGMSRNLEQQANEPVAWMSDQDVGFKKSEFGNYPCVPLYTRPQPAAQWVGLTDEDELDWDGGDLKSLIAAVEAKLKEKNT